MNDSPSMPSPSTRDSTTSQHCSSNCKLQHTDQLQPTLRKDHLMMRCHGIGNDRERSRTEKCDTNYIYDPLRGRKRRFDPFFAKCAKPQEEKKITPMKLTFGNFPNRIDEINCLSPPKSPTIIKSEEPKMKEEIADRYQRSKRSTNKRKDPPIP